MIKKNLKILKNVVYSVERLAKICTKADKGETASLAVSKVNKYTFQEIFTDLACPWGFV